MNEHLPRFVVAAGAAVGDRLELAADEAKHARVRRLRTGDAVALFDGRGRSYVGAIESLAGAGVTVRITAERPLREGESPLALTLAIGLLKTDRFEWLIEKATELGVGTIQPFTSTHTLAQPGTARRARWQQIVLAAAKQCGRSVAPELGEPVPFEALLATGDTPRLLLCERGGGIALLAAPLAAPSELMLIVGAEGGFSAAEVDAAQRAGCLLIDAGPRILRAETAAIAALAVCQSRWGDAAALRQAQGERKS